MDAKESDLKKTQHSSPGPRLGIFSIANQLRYGLTLLVILSLLITAGWLIYLAFQTQVQQLEVAQQERSRAAAGEINAYIDDLQRKLAYLARVQGLTDFSPQTQKNLLDGLSRHNDAYEMIAILNETGQVVTAALSQDKSLSGNLADSPLFLRTFKQREDYIGPVEQDSVTGLPKVTLAVPIRNQQDEVAGVLLAQVNLKYLWYVVSQTGVGDTGYAYIIDNRNFLIAEKGSSAETFKLQDISDQPFIQSLTSSNVDLSKAYPGLKGQDVLGAIAPIRSLHWNVVVELPTSEAFAAINYMLIVMGGVLSAATAVMVGLGIYFSQQIVQPLQHLTKASAQISAGNMDTRVNVRSRNEMGILATTFNEMTAQLKDLYTTLEQRVASRTRRLEVAATLGERLMSVLNPEELLDEVVNQVKENFGYYHTHIYLLDDSGQNLVVTAGTGEAGTEMKARHHSILLEAQTSLVARAARSGEIVKVDNVREAIDWLPNPLLPNTYSEMAVPISLEGRIVGVLDVQEDKVAGLDEGDVSLLRSLANQVAVTIRNAHLFDEVEQALAEAYATQERYVEQSWEKSKIIDRGGQSHYYTRANMLPLDEAKKQAVAEAKKQALKQNQLTVVNINGAEANETVVVSPVILRNKPIGSIHLYPASDDQLWTEDDLAVIQVVAEELAQTADNLRLFDETRERAGREQAIREITEKIRAATSLEELARTAAQELGQHFSSEYTWVELGTEGETEVYPAVKNGY